MGPLESPTGDNRCDQETKSHECPKQAARTLGDRSSRPTHFADWATEAARSSL